MKWLLTTRKSNTVNEWEEGQQMVDDKVKSAERREQEEQHADFWTGIKERQGKLQYITNHDGDLRASVKLEVLSKGTDYVTKL
jgi:hypothetical protein